MKPITFSCEEILPLAPEDIARQILDLTKWPDFRGYGPIPGIKAAEFGFQSPGFLNRAIVRHLRQMRTSGVAGESTVTE
jgi:hypothetical protein